MKLLNPCFSKLWHFWSSLKSGIKLGIYGFLTWPVALTHILCVDRREKKPQDPNELKFQDAERPSENSAESVEENTDAISAVKHGEDKEKEKPMQTEEAARKLRQMYDDAESDGEQTTAIHYFAVKYAKQIEDISPKDIVVRAGMSEAYKTEISKGRKLAKYVTISRTPHWDA